MTRICSYCDKLMGWKCHKCSTTITPSRVPLIHGGVSRKGFCSKCFKTRLLESGGTTHSICDDCIEKEKEKVR